MVKARVKSSTGLLLQYGASKGSNLASCSRVEDKLWNNTMAWGAGLKKNAHWKHHRTATQSNLLCCSSMVSSIWNTLVKADWGTSRCNWILSSFLRYYIPCVFSSGEVLAFSWGSGIFSCPRWNISCHLYVLCPAISHHKECHVHQNLHQLPWHLVHLHNSTGTDGSPEKRGEVVLEFLERVYEWSQYF